ncbi:MAG: YggS family pyridoxal phosphate-dependent enzyme [Cardiobacteriaceae bacterium]|nr:YggS family pyridoxal phosphate-dependent enzyme [Cardiobacteriaceae bacterium]
MILRPAYPQATTLDELRANFAAIESRIAAACARAGRAPHSVRLLPVSKTVDESRIRMVHSLGYTHFGENKVQEAQAKAQAMADLPLHWSVIGHLQTNKIKYMVKFAHEFQALDSVKVAQMLDERLAREGRQMNVLVQINTSGEDSKYGMAPDAAHAFLRDIAPLGNLRVTGLMTLALFSGEEAKVRDCFVILRELREHLRADLPDGMTMTELSMGMSGDFDMAIEEGATIVRIGQALFGARQLPDSHYWPG